MQGSVSHINDLDFKSLEQLSQARTNSNFFYPYSFSQPQDLFDLNKISLAVDSMNLALSENKHNSMSQLLKEIFDFTSIGQNWDGYDAIPVYCEIANKTISFLEKINHPWINYISDIFPNPTGTITIEWEKNQNEALILEIGKNNYSYFIKFKNKEPLFYDGLDILSHIEDFTKNLSMFIGKQIAT